MSKKRSEERKVLYYIGLFLTILGILIFFSTFFVMFDDIPSGRDLGSNFLSFGDSMYSFAGRGFGGFIIISVGAILMNIGRANLRILAPEQTEEDLESWNRSRDEVDDTLDKEDVVRGLTTKPGSSDNYREKIVVKVRCPFCRELNDEDARFCTKCGRTI